MTPRAEKNTKIESKSRFVIRFATFFLFFEPKRTLFKKFDFSNFNQIQLPIWTT